MFDNFVHVLIQCSDMFFQCYNPCSVAGLFKKASDNVILFYSSIDLTNVLVRNLSFIFCICCNVEYTEIIFLQICSPLSKFLQTPA